MAVDLGRSVAMSALTEHRRNHGYILLLLAYYVIVRRAFHVHSLAIIVVSFLVRSLFSSKSESIVDDAIIFDLEMFELRPDKKRRGQISIKIDNSPANFEKGLQTRIQFTGPVQESTAFFLSDGIEQTQRH
jgi:hypothetical protein